MEAGQFTVNNFPTDSVLLKILISPLSSILSHSPPSPPLFNPPGSVAPQVNAGPLAFLSAFLAPTRLAEKKDDAGDVEELRVVFDEFLSACSLALDVHKKRVTEAQQVGMRSVSW